MIFRKLFGLFFLGLLVFGLVGLISAGGRSRYQAAWLEGYAAGQQAAVSAEQGTTGGAQGAAVPAAPPAPVYGFGHGWFFPGFGMFFCFLPLFLFGLPFLFFGRRHGRRGHWHGHRGWRGHEHQQPPRQSGHWADFDDWPDEPVQKA
jgi:hypothetical protein